MANSYGINEGNYFDFGGSSGRVFRHFHFQSTAWRVWSCGFKLTSVEWNLTHFPAAITVFQGMYFPFLSIEDRTFDLISAMSVFTHIDETETSWLLELRRILKPGGIAIVTIHNEDTWLNMPAELRVVIEKCTPELAAMPTLPQGRSVSRWRVDDPYRCHTFHSNDYIRQQWARMLDVKEIIPKAFDAQAAVILQRRP
jgi:SAM-dependent methyltransferase